MLLVRVSRPSRRMLSVGLESEFSLFQGWNLYLVQSCLRKSNTHPWQVSVQTGSVIYVLSWIIPSLQVEGKHLLDILKGFLRFAPVYWLFVHKAIYPFSPHMCPAANMGDILNCIVTRIAVGLQVTGETLKHLFGNLPFTAGSVLIQRNVLFWWEEHPHLWHLLWLTAILFQDRAVRFVSIYNVTPEEFFSEGILTSTTALSRTSSWICLLKSHFCPRCILRCLQL